MRRLLLALSLVVAACAGDGAETTTTTASASVRHADPTGDCRFSFTEGATDCGPGADIVEVGVDAAGPIVLTIELADAPRYDTDFQWLVEFSISDLACGLTNSRSQDGSFVGTATIGAYGYRELTNEDAPAGTCDGSLAGTTATLIFNIQPPQGPWTILGGTQQVEIANLDDPGSSDDVAIDGPSG